MQCAGELGSGDFREGDAWAPPLSSFLSIARQLSPLPRPIPIPLYVVFSLLLPLYFDVKILYAIYPK